MDDLVIAVATPKSLEAYRTLFEHFAPRVKPFLIGNGTGPEVAEEAVQEANLIRLAVRRIRNEIGESECVSIIIQERVAAYTSSLKDPVASSTVFTYILDLLAHVRRIAPERDWSWLADIKNRLCARAHPAKDKTP